MYVHRYAKNNHFPLNFAIFTKALQTDGPTDRPMDRRTDKPSYRDAIAAFLSGFAFRGGPLGLFMCDPPPVVEN